MRLRRIASLVLVAVVVLAMVAGCGGQKKLSLLRLGSETWNEPQALMEMVRLLIEEKVPGVKVEHQRNFSGTNLLHDSMTKGEIHVYLSWTGTTFTGQLGMAVTPEWKDRDKVYSHVRDEVKKRFGFIVMPPLGYENTYAVAVRRDVAEEKGLKTVSDLVPHAPEMSIGTDVTFQEREGDGYRAFSDHYGLQFGEAVSMDVGLLYRATEAREIDAAIAYSIDGRIKQMDLVLLQDDLRFFPPYDAVLVVHPDVFESYPQLQESLGQLSGRITTQRINDMMYEADVNGKDVTELARDFLVAEGLLQR